MVKKIRKKKDKEYTHISIPLSLSPGQEAGWRVSNDGKSWKTIPADQIVNIAGGLQVHGVPQMQVVNIQDLDNDIESLFNGIISSAGRARKKPLETKLYDCKQKMYAARFHLLALLKEINHQVEEFEKRPSELLGVDRETWNPILVYETESFLFQVKSNVDLAIQAIREVMPCLIKFDSAKKEVVDELRQNGETGLSEFFESQYNQWIKTLKTWRDTITHYSGLKEFRCFLEEHQGKGAERSIHYPEISEGIRADLYCQETYVNLYNYYRIILDEIGKRLQVP